MQYLKDFGFVIRRINFGEADRFVTFYTKYNGKIEVVAKGVRKISSKRASSIELLNLVKFQAVKSSKNFILTEVELQDPFEYIKKDLHTVSTAFLICELIDKLCPVGQRHEEIFELVHKIVQSFARDEKLGSESQRVRVFRESEDQKYSYVADNRQAYQANNALFAFQVDLLTKLGFWNDSRKFKDELDLQEFIESVAERKIKTKIYS